MIRRCQKNLRVLTLVSLCWSTHAATDDLANLRQMYDGTMLPGGRGGELLSLG
jgi:hypothetical protein